MRKGILFVLVCVIVIAILFWSGATRREDAFVTPSGAAVNCLLFSHDGKYLIAGSHSMRSVYSPEYFEGELSVWEMVANSQLHALPMPQWIRSLSLSADGGLLAAAIGGPKYIREWANEGTPREVRLYSFPDMKPRGVCKCDGYVHSSALSPDGRLLATACRADDPSVHSEVQVWDTDQGNVLYRIPQPTSGNYRVRFSPDGCLLAAIDVGDPQNPRSSTQPILRQYLVVSGELIKAMELPHSDEVVDIDYFPEGKKLLVQRTGLSCWDTLSGEEIKLTSGLVPWSHSTKSTLSRDGNLLVAVNPLHMSSRLKPAQILVWDVVGKKMREEWKWKGIDGGILAIALSPDRQLLALGSDKVYFFRLRSR